MPVEALAVDLTRRGLGYARNRGFTVDGEPVSDYEAARVTSSVLTIAAEFLGGTGAKLPSAAIEDAIDATVARIDSAVAEAVAAAPADDPDALAAAYADADAAPWNGRAMLRALNVARRRPDALTRDRAAAEDFARWSEHGDALARTARDVRASPAAQAAMLRALRATLPAGAPASTAAVSAWLAQWDELDRVRRPVLVREYAAAGSPGALSASELRTLAAERWGAPRPLHGYPTYRPAERTAA